MILKNLSDNLKSCSKCFYYFPQMGGGTGFGYCECEEIEDVIVEEIGGYDCPKFKKEEDAK